MGCREKCAPQPQSCQPAVPIALTSPCPTKGTNSTYLSISKQRYQRHLSLHAQLAVPIALISSCPTGRTNSTYLSMSNWRYQQHLTLHVQPAIPTALISSCPTTSVALTGRTNSTYLSMSHNLRSINRSYQQHLPLHVPQPQWHHVLYTGRTNSKCSAIQ